MDHFAGAYLKILDKAEKGSPQRNTLAYLSKASVMREKKNLYQKTPVVCIIKILQS